jgi:hypothetical protein
MQLLTVLIILKHMRLQVNQDSKCNATGVFIPMSEWKKLKKQHSD